MTFFWLIAWVICSAPALSFEGNVSDWSNWSVALVVCVVIDVIGSLSR